MLQVYSNRAPMKDYVELQFGPAAIRVRGVGNEAGWSVSSHVFSHDSKYDGLVDFSKNFRAGDKAVAEKLLRETAAKFGLIEDVGLKHRKHVWGVK